jgi:hypothetical protein
MEPFGGCLEESDPDCTTYGLADITITPSGQTIEAGGTKVASVKSWTMVVDLSMEGAKTYGNSTVVLNTTQGIVRPGEASKCIDLCDKDLMSRAQDTGGISNGENAVIVDSIITDEETLATLPVSVIPTSTPTVNQESNKRPQTDIPTDALNIIAETNTNPVPCKVSVSISIDETTVLYLFAICPNAFFHRLLPLYTTIQAAIGCAVSLNGKLIECRNFRKSSQDVVEIQWTYSIMNGCEHPIKARRAKIMKCHKVRSL